MRRSRPTIARLVALILPANLVLVFFACTIQCMAAMGPASIESEGSEACCAAAEKRCGALELSERRTGCQIFVERGVLGAGGQRNRVVLDATAAISLGPAAVLFGSEPRRLDTLAHGPPRMCPLDRLPTLLI